MIENIALRSFQSELSHISALPAIIEGKIVTKLLFIIFFCFHIHRYITNFDEALILSKKQKNLWPFNVIDYTIILLYLLILHKSKSNYLLFIFAILSGLLSFFFIYIEHGTKTNFSNNMYVDIFMVVFLILIFFYEKNNKIRFFVIRDLTYHIIEFIYFY
jgi:hypothetical protein